MNDFTLHPRLESDTIFVADWPLSRLVLMNDARFPWIILVPRRDGLREWHELAVSDAACVAGEISRAAAALMQVTNCTKINIGALGNLVPQLHIHVVARNPGDAAWPGPVWGQGEATSYDTAALAALMHKLAPLLT